VDFDIAAMKVSGLARLFAGEAREGTNAQFLALPTDLIAQAPLLIAVAFDAQSEPLDERLGCVFVKAARVSLLGYRRVNVGVPLGQDFGVVAPFKGHGFARVRNASRRRLRPYRLALRGGHRNKVKVISCAAN
jgi:hypothetical protein